MNEKLKNRLSSFITPVKDYEQKSVKKTLNISTIPNLESPSKKRIHITPVRYQGIQSAVEIKQPCEPTEQKHLMFANVVGSNIKRFSLASLFRTESQPPEQRFKKYIERMRIVDVPISTVVKEHTYKSFKF